MKDNRDRSDSQEDQRSAAFYRKRAADVRSVGKASENIAQIAETAFDDIGSVGVDFGQRISLRLRECAREAAWTATQLDVYAFEAERDDIGRTSEVRNNAPVIVLADVRDGAA